MDPKQIDELRRWGQRLSRDEDQPELRSAGRAILMLIQEVESLQDAPPTEPPADEPGAPGPGEQAEPPRPAPRSRRSHRVRGMRRLAVALTVLGALIFATFALGSRLAAPSLDPQGPERNAQIGPAVLPSLKFSVGADPSILNKVHWELDGTDVTGKAYYTGGRFVLDGNQLKDGEHRLTASAAGG